MFRMIALFFVGLVALVSGILRIGSPARQEEQTGWLYQNFGDKGIGGGMIVMGAVFLIIATVVFARIVKKWRTM